jgi:hypothetical protein
MMDCFSVNMLYGMAKNVLVQQLQQALQCMNKVQLNPPQQLTSPP